MATHCSLHPKSLIASILVAYSFQILAGPCPLAKLAQNSLVPDRFRLESPQALVQRQKELFLKIFQEQETFEAFIGRVEKEAASDPAIKEAKRVLQEEDFDVVIYTRALPTGDSQSASPLNLHQPNLDKKDEQRIRRDYVESAMLKLDMKDYGEISAGIKPKYGLVRPKPASSFVFPDPGYGASAWIVDLNKVRDRLTVAYGGDSYVRFLGEYPRIFGARSKPPQIDRWDFLFIPWEFREVNVGLLAEGIRKNQFRIGTSDPLHSTGLASREYMEVQVFGEVKPEEIKAFEYSESVPPSPEGIEMLGRHKIEVWKITSQGQRVRVK